MSRSRSFCFVPVVLASLVALPSPARGQTSQIVTEENARARELFRRGAAAMKDGKYADARKILLEAWSLRRTYDVASVLGQAELELKLYRDAAEHLDFALKNFAPRESAETLEKVKTGLQTAKLHVAELRISVNEPNAQIWLDGQQVGTSPLLSSLFVATGPHTIEARLDVDRVARQTVDAASGSAYTLDLVLAERPVAGPSSGLESSPPPMALRDRPSDSPSLVPVFVSGGLFVAGLAVGIGYRVAAASSHDELEALQAKTGRDGCSTGSAAFANCEAQREAGESVDSRRNVSTAGFFVAGAAAVGTAVYWFWPRSAASAGASHKPRFLVSGAPAPGGGSVVVVGSF
jgi:hypothetical protein